MKEETITTSLLFLQDFSLEPKRQNLVFNTCGNILLVLILQNDSVKNKTTTELSLKILNILSTDNEEIQRELFQNRETFVQIAINSQQTLISREHSLWILDNLLPYYK